MGRGLSGRSKRTPSDIYFSDIRNIIAKHYNSSSGLSYRDSVYGISMLIAALAWDMRSGGLGNRWPEFVCVLMEGVQGWLDSVEREASANEAGLGKATGEARGNGEGT